MKKIVFVGFVLFLCSSVSADDKKETPKFLGLVGGFEDSVVADAEACFAKLPKKEWPKTGAYCEVLFKEVDNTTNVIFDNGSDIQIKKAENNIIRVRARVDADKIVYGKKQLGYEISISSISKFDENGSWWSGEPLTVEEVKAAITEFFWAVRHRNQGLNMLTLTAPDVRHKLAFVFFWMSEIKSAWHFSSNSLPPPCSNYP
ncbi:MAG: hypothetical protein HYS98_04260 [Deltaproteobacteria bacterium]|nr:hypothetical protein [Deltaproteobacteria bacterium]